MAITRDEKEYWINTIIDEIGKKQSDLIKLIGLTEKDLRKRMVDTFIDETGTTDLVNQYRALKAEEEALNERIRQINRESDEIRKEISVKMDVSYYDSYYVIASDDIGAARGSKFAPESRKKAIESLSVGAEYLKLEEDKRNVKRAVMLATTSAEMKALVEKYFKNLGVSLD